jgi:hypothetical protein
VVARLRLATTRRRAAQRNSAPNSVRTVRAIDPNLGRLIAGEVGPPACSVVSTGNQLAFDADERNLNNRIRHDRVSLKRI